MLPSPYKANECAQARGHDLLTACVSGAPPNGRSYDPMRKCWTTVQQTLKRMNLPFTEKQLITEVINEWTMTVGGLCHM